MYIRMYSFVSRYIHGISNLIYIHMICIHIGFFSQFLSVILQLRLRSADLRLGMFPDGQLAAGESMDVSAGGASVDRCLGEIRGGCGGDVTRNDGSLREQGICDMLHSCVFVYFYSCIWYTYIYILYVDIWYIYIYDYIYICIHTIQGLFSLF